MERADKFIEAMLKRAREAGAAYERARPEIEAAEKALQLQAEQALQAGKVRHLGACGVPERILELYRDQRLNASEALQAVFAWRAELRDAPTRKPFLVLLGGPGTGKSVAASRVLLEALRLREVTVHPLAELKCLVREYDPKRGLFATAAQLHYAPRFTDNRQPTLLDRAATVQWLVLDELRAADGRGAGQERLEELLGERHAWARPTVITSNLAGGELKDVVGIRLASRFAESAKVVDLGDADMRRQR